MASKSKSIFIALWLIMAFAWAGMAYVFWVQRTSLDDPQTRLNYAREALQQGDDQTASELLSPLAAQGNAPAQFLLAEILQHGVGVPIDFPRAIDNLQKAAEQGFVPAQARLGDIYLDGSEVLQDFGQARVWLNKAALNNSVRAARLLGRMDEQGLGGKQNKVRAYAWYELAAADGDRMAAAWRDALVGQLSDAELKQAQSLALQLAAQRHAPAPKNNTAKKDPTALLSTAPPNPAQS